MHIREQVLARFLRRRRLVEQVDRRGGCARRRRIIRRLHGAGRSQLAPFSSVSACKVVSVAARARSLAAVVARCIHSLSLSVVVRSGRGRFVLCWCFEAAAAAPWSRPVWSDAKQREVNAAVAGSLCAFLFFFAQRAVWLWTPSLRQPPQNAENSV